MIDSFVFNTPTKIYFGYGRLSELQSILTECKVKSAVLVCDRFFNAKGISLWEDIEQISAVFSDVEPDPQLSGVEDVVNLIREYSADTVIALGGGSSIDTAKFAAACAYSSNEPAEHFDLLPFPENKAKIIAIPTTAGTGSEVTSVSVLSRGKEKKTIHNAAFCPFACIVDPELTMTVPAKTAMITGLDAFTHAIEAFWSVKHSSLTDILAAQSMKLIMKNIERSCFSPDKESRTAMSYASLLAGLAFSQAKTAACHACSYPLSMYHHLPHGEACAFTLDSFIELNADSRLEMLSRELGFGSASELASEIRRLKSTASLKSRLCELEGEVNIEKTAAESAEHMLMKNNPTAFTKDELIQMFKGLS